MKCFLCKENEANVDLKLIMDAEIHYLCNQCHRKLEQLKKERLL